MGKSSHHKTENTFRFQTFSERIAKINIDVIHQIRHHDDTPEESSTYFAQALDKQSELNCTDHFGQFRQEISSQVQTFTQLVYHENTIVAALQKHLLVPNSLALPALMDLLVQLARDLQSDFYRHFHDFFDVLVQLLNRYTQNVEVLECTFTCLSYLFKFLWRYLVKDIEQVYGYFSSLLGSNYKEYVRNFAAESFAFLMRKVQDQSALFDFMFMTLHDEPDKCDGVGRLMFEMMKGVKQQFHSCTIKVFPVLLQKLGSCGTIGNGSSLPLQEVEGALTTTLLSMAKHANRETIVQLWDLLLPCVSDTYTRWHTATGSDKSDALEMFERLLRLVLLLVQYSNGKMIHNPDSIGKMLTQFLGGGCLQEFAGHVLLDVISSLLITSHKRMEVEVTSRLMPSVFKTEYPVAMVYDFTRSMFDLALFEKDVLPSLLRYTNSHLRTNEEDTLSLVTDLLLNKSPLPSNGSELDKCDTYMLDFGSGSTDSCFPTYITSILDNGIPLRDSDLAMLWSALVCLPHCRPIKQSKMLKKLSDVIHTFLRPTLAETQMENNVAFVCCQAVVTMVMMLGNKEVFTYIPVDLITACVCKNSSNVHVLRMVDIYLTNAVTENAQDLLTSEVLLCLYSALKINLSSPHSLVRLLTLRIFASFDLPLQSADPETLDVFKICLCAETTPASLHEYREKQRHLQKLEYVAVQNCLPGGQFSETPLRYLIGCLYINFKLLMEPIKMLIASHVDNMERQAFWDIYSTYLEQAAKDCEESMLSTPESRQSPVDTTEHPISATFEATLSDMSGDISVQPNFVNFRAQLWRTMYQFPDKCSPKSRVFVPLFFRFLENEYYQSDMSIAPTQNVLKQHLYYNVDSGDDTMDIDNEETATNQCDKVNLSEGEKVGGKVKDNKDAIDLGKNKQKRRQIKSGCNDVDSDNRQQKDFNIERVRTQSHSSVESNEIVISDDNNEHELLTRSRSKSLSNVNKNKSSVEEDMDTCLPVTKMRTRSAANQRHNKSSVITTKTRKGNNEEKDSTKSARTEPKLCKENEDAKVNENMSVTRLKTRSQSGKDKSDAKCDGKFPINGRKSHCGGTTGREREQEKEINIKQDRTSKRQLHIDSSDADDTDDEGIYISSGDSEIDFPKLKMAKTTGSVHACVLEKSDYCSPASSTNDTNLQQENALGSPRFRIDCKRKCVYKSSFKVDEICVDEEGDGVSARGIDVASNDNHQLESAMEETDNETGLDKEDPKVKDNRIRKISQKDKSMTDGVDAVNKRRKAATSSLLAHLELFTKFTDPKSMYMEPRLRQLYFDLLIHKNVDVQKAAFQCILTYKYDYLTPYRENFLRLLEDKSFKNEIVLFSIDNESSAISSEHRPDVLPFLMRILYGKMHVKTGKGTSGKQYSHVRQSIVFRFLNGCQPDELRTFIELVFAPFTQFITDNPYKMVKDLKENLDLTRVLPVKKMHGALISMDVIFKKLGHLLDSYLPSVIQIIIGMAMLCHLMLESRDKLVPHVVTPLKSIRQNTVYRIIQILNDYDKYPWRPVEIDALFESVVWPQLEKLPFEGLYHPTPLLKLLHCCTQNPRLFSFLGKHHPDDVNLTPLCYIIKLLLRNDVSTAVTSFILEMIHNLLEDREESQPQEITVIEVNNMVDLASADNIKDTDIGIRLLLPYIHDILKYIQIFVSSLPAHFEKKSSSFKELNVLSRISSFAQDDETCTTLVKLLLPFLSQKFKKLQKTEEDLLLSVLNLLHQIPDRVAFFRPVSHLFASLVHRSSRMLLCDIFETVCEKDQDLQPLCQIVKQLNSWDHTRMDEPDYMKRLEGYRAASTLIKSLTSVDTRVCYTLLHNCCFFVCTVDDMSLRDSSTHCLLTMLTHFNQPEFNDDMYNKIIVPGLLPELKSGLRNKKQTVLHEFVTILAHLVDKYGDQSSFTELKPLRDKDIEADFYENVKHIQVYKRSRAIRRLVKYLLSNKTSKDTLTSFFLPMVSSFISDDTYKKHAPVQDAAVEAIGVICRLLPWKLYLNQLKHYLKLLPKKLDKQKLLVRVVVAVLDNFHFDLSNSTLNVKNAPKLAMEEEPVKQDASVDSKLHDTEEITEGDSEKPTPEINEAAEEITIPDTKVKQLCSVKLATKMHEIILQHVIANLHKILVQKMQNDGELKINKSKYAEDDEILRVPIALAMVKLLQNLPKGALQKYLPGILLKVCNFLKSRSVDIRNTARDTLVKIQLTLGPRYFPFILSELRGTLRKGYQRHVLCYTVHQLLSNMESSVKQGDIDVCLHSLQQVLTDEIFGEVSEEKDVSGIKANVFEARTSKSYESYQFIAKYISTGSLMKLIEPLKLVLDTTTKHKAAKKVLDVLKKVACGLLENENITMETLLVFVYGLTTQTLPLLKEDKSVTSANRVEDVPGRKPQSCLLLQEAAPRGGLKPKASKKTNKHVLVEFGLQLLNMALKKQKIVSSDTTHLQMLDPLIPVIAECLQSKYVMMNVDSLRVICHLLKFQLPSLHTNITKIANGMFVLLHNYASAGAAKGDNMELVSVLFKAVTVLVRDVKYYTIDNTQLQVLLTFCEEDLHDHNRQSTAFNLLKAILTRKLNVLEIHQLMKKVQEMSITAESAHVQRECRQAMLQYLLDYPLGKKIQAHLQFYVSQLQYELETGRESALEMMAAFFSSFPQALLVEYSGLFFVPMAASLINDESVKCRKLISLAIKSLLGQLEHNSRTRLYGIVIKWFMDEKLKHRTLAAQLCGLFVEVEGAQFETRLSETLQVIEQQLEPGRYKKVESESLEHDQDHMIYNTLNTLIKVLRECNQVLLTAKWDDSMNTIWEHVESYLSYPHIWVQLAASQLFGLLFSAWQPEQLVAAAQAVTAQAQCKRQYLTTDTSRKLRSLAHSFITQLQSSLLNEELANQIIKNMIFLIRCAKYLELSEDVRNVQMADTYKKPLTVLWLVRKMVREAHHEAISNNKAVLKRMNIFKWMGAVAIDFGKSLTSSMLTSMIGPLQRETNDQSSYQDQNLRTLAIEVIEYLKKSAGLEKFTEVYSSTQKVRAERKDERQKNRAFQAVANPEFAAKRKIKKNLAKSVAKKRKVEQMKPSKKSRKRKYEEFAIKN